MIYIRFTCKHCGYFINKAAPYMSEIPCKCGNSNMVRKVWHSFTPYLICIAMLAVFILLYLFSKN